MPQSFTQPASSFVLDIPEACREARVSRTYLYGAIKSGQLRITKLGRRTLIRREALHEWIARAEMGATVATAPEAA